MAHFTVKEKQYEFAPVSSLSFDEAREAKRISGMAVGQITYALGDMDPDAWLAMFVVSMQRVNGDITAADLADENLVALVNETFAEADAGPPAEGAKAPTDQHREEPATPASEAEPDGTGETSASAVNASPAEVEALS